MYKHRHYNTSTIKRLSYSVTRGPSFIIFWYLFFFPASGQWVHPVGWLSAVLMDTPLATAYLQWFFITCKISIMQKKLHKRERIRLLWTLFLLKKKKAYFLLVPPHKGKEVGVKNSSWKPSSSCSNKASSPLCLKQITSKLLYWYIVPLLCLNFLDGCVKKLLDYIFRHSTLPQNKQKS